MQRERDPNPRSLTFEEVTRIAKETILKHGNHIPTLIADGSKRPVFTQIVDMEATPEGRVQQMFTTGFILARSGQVGVLNQVFFITEAWLSTATADELPEKRPSEDPQRKEVLLISSFKVSQRQQRSAVIEMVRDSSGKLVDLHEIEFGEESEGENRLLTAFVVGFTAASTARFN
jgi:hypothetical protein